MHSLSPFSVFQDTRVLGQSLGLEMYCGVTEQIKLGMSLLHLCSKKNNEPESGSMVSISSLFNLMPWY